MRRLSSMVLSVVMPFLLVAPAAATPESLPVAHAEDQAQGARMGRLVITVVDPSGAVIAGATVTVTGPADAANAAAIAPVKTSEKGVATVERLAPGRYAIVAEFSGFGLGILKDVRVSAGDSRHVVVLPLPRVQDSVTVKQDPVAAASDPRGRAFGTALTREQIDALSDDPDEMRRQLEEMAGPGAVIRVDSFEGGRLPPKSQIKSIHITRDAFAAENHGAGGIFVDIITQPGIGALRGGFGYRLMDGSLSGRNPLVPKKGPERTQNFNVGMGGSLIKDKSSFSVSVTGIASFDTPNLYAALPEGLRSETLSLRRPRDTFSVSGLFDYAITRDQTLRASFGFNRMSSGNLGVGAYDLAERAYSSDQRSGNVRIQEAGPLGRRFFTNTRLQIMWSDSESASATEAPTIRVSDAFTGGGAQVAGGRRTRTVDLASDLDYVRGIHSVRTGVVLNGVWARSNDSSNHLGTYTFESLDAFNAGLPRSYTRRIGDPNIDYFNLQAGFYVQDDLRVRKSLTISPGIRYEVQTHVKDYGNLGPRIGITWAPFKSGKTTLRASAGRFYDWLSTGTYEQTLRVDGFRQRELNILNPPYPDPGNVGALSATNRYLLDPDLQLARSTRVSAGIDQTIGTQVRVSAGYAYSRGTGLLRGVNLNAPAGGIRPDPTFANIVQVVSDASSRNHSLSTNASISLSPAALPKAGEPAPAAPFFDWKRNSVMLGYSINFARNNTDGAFSVPATGDLASEWGPSSGDVRHRVTMGIMSSALRNLMAMFFITASTGSPYTVLTGHDDNGDLIFNDRPAGVGRNTLRTLGQWNVSGNFSYSIGLGKRKPAEGPGTGGMTTVAVGGAGGVVAVSSMAMPTQAARYRLSINVSLSNLTNHANWVGYSGVMTSPFFGKPTTVQGTRRVDMGVNFSF